MFNSEFLGSWDLPENKTVTVEIAVVKQETITGEGGRTDDRPVIQFKGKEKRFIANATNCKAIARAYGTDTDGWIGKTVTLFVTKVKNRGEEMDAIRVKIPRDKRGFGPAA